MIRRPPRSTRTDTLFPYTTLFRSGDRGARYAGPGHRAAGGQLRRRQTAGALPFERPLLYCWCSNDLSGIPSVALQRSPLAPKGFPKLPAIAGLSFATAARSEERRVGKECVGTCRSRWWPYLSKKKKQRYTTESTQ